MKELFQKKGYDIMVKLKVGRYDMRYLEKAETVLRKILLCKEFDKSVSVRDFELSK